MNSTAEIGQVVALILSAAVPNVRKIAAMEAVADGRLIAALNILG